MNIDDSEKVFDLCNFFTGSTDPTEVTSTVVYANLSRKGSVKICTVAKSRTR
jgi:hypothetical protein